MIKRLISCVILLTLLSCADYNEQSPASYVNPFIGTDYHGHTFPGATTPFGLVQLSPDTGTSGWDWCSGYHNSDSSIMGFSHSHLSGTGSTDLGDILFMPTLTAEFKPGSKEEPDEGYRSRFSHKSEKAEAGYYSVFLDDVKTNVELTASAHVGVQRYSFETSEDHYVMIDLSHGISDTPTDCYIKSLSDTVVVGYRKSTGWADSHTVYFYAEFSNPYISMQTLSDTVETGCEGKAASVISALKFSKDVENLQIKVAISYVDIDGAKGNLAEEVGNKDFDAVRKMAFDSWNNALSRVEVDGNKTRKEIFYTALYHSMIAPYLMSDCDGRYRSSNTNVYKGEDPNYGLYSTWDTFRALHPLLTVVVPEKNTQFVKSLIRYYEESGRLPVWDLNMRENFCMIGYHSVPIIADAFFKGEKFDAEKALEAMIHSATEDSYSGLGYYRQYRYIPYDLHPNSVSKTLEFAYDDWCISQVAKSLGKEDIYKQYIERAQYYKNQFDSVDTFMKGRNSNGFFRQNFQPTDSKDFTEGNSWHYSFFVPQDLNTLISLMGGDERFENKLDELFTSESVESDHPDVTGLIGNYAHGNEPSHHAAYLYAYAGKQWKTAERVSQICNELYTAKRDGLCGNEDCGQMSAWYVLSAMGFYEVTPGSSIYVLGSPQFERVTIHNLDGTEFNIIAEDLSDKNIYIGSATWNDNSYNKSYITHDMISSGGNLILKMQNKPSDSFGCEEVCRPHSVISDNVKSSESMLSQITFSPYVDVSERFFENEIKFNARSIIDADLYYSYDKSVPISGWKKVTCPFVINKDTKLNLVAKRKGTDILSQITSFDFYKGRIPSAKIEFPATSERYCANGALTLTDGLSGETDYTNGKWLGWNGGDITISVELPVFRNISFVGVDFLSCLGAWINAPEYYTIEFETESGKQTCKVDIPDNNFVGNVCILCGKNVNVLSNKFKIIIPKNTIPAWHNLHGNTSWVFIDEILVR